MKHWEDHLSGGLRSVLKGTNSAEPPPCVDATEDFTSIFMDVSSQAQEGDRLQWAEGRCFTLNGESQYAPLEEGPGWAAPLPPLEGLDRETADRLAQDWATAAQAEHSSLASFHRFTLELLAFGAPPELIQGTHVAAADELRHARLCLTLASRYKGHPLRPGPLPLAGISYASTRAELALATFHEGVVGETLSTLLAEAALRRTRDPQVQKVLQVISSDEARHAALAWKTLQWCLETGGEGVRDVLHRALTSLQVEGALAPSTAVGPEPVFVAHGRLSHAASQVVVDHGVQKVILPLLEAMLNAPVVSATT